MDIILINLEKIGIGILLFLGSYISNIGLGAWKNVKIDGVEFDWNLILQSLLKFFVLGGSIALLSIVVSMLPSYITYIGIEMDNQTMETIDSLLIITMFLTASIKYVKESIGKLNIILGINSIEK